MLYLTDRRFNAKQKKSIIEIMKWAADCLPSIDHPELYVQIRPLPKVDEGKVDGFVEYDEDEENMYVVCVDRRLEGEEFVRTVVHELKHLEQFLDKRLKVNGPRFYWMGVRWPEEINNVPYEQRPWEAEAYALEQKYVDLLV